MRHPHIATGKHTGGNDPRFRINTAPGLMEPTRGVNEAHGSFLDRTVARELRDELSAWLEANPTAEELAQRGRANAWDEGHLDVCTDCVCDLARVNPYRTGAGQ